jgi:hypothetical protein
MECFVTKLHSLFNNFLLFFDILFAFFQIENENGPAYFTLAKLKKLLTVHFPGTKVTIHQVRSLFKGLGLLKPHLDIF